MYEENDSRLSEVIKLPVLEKICCIPIVSSKSRGKSYPLYFEAVPTHIKDLMRSSDEPIGFPFILDYNYDDIFDLDPSELTGISALERNLNLAKGNQILGEKTYEFFEPDDEKFLLQLITYIPEILSDNLFTLSGYVPGMEDYVLSLFYWGQVEYW